MTKDIIDWIVISFAWFGMVFAIFKLLHDWPPRKEQRNLRRMKEHAGKILRWVTDGHTNGGELELSEILMLGINPGFHHMGAVYFALIQALDHETRVKIIDRVIEHGRNRCPVDGGMPDLVQCIGALNKTEAETVIMCMTRIAPPVVDYIDRYYLKYDTIQFANEVIAFRLANP